MADILYHSFIGLDNLGNTCFLNSGLQIIMNCHKFIIDILNDINNNQDKAFGDSISISFINLIKIMLKKYIRGNNIKTINDIYNFKNLINHNNFEENCNNISISPLNFKDNFFKKHPLYANNQHDCIEFIRVFMNDLSEENNRNKSINPHKVLSHSGKNKKESSIEFHNYFLSREISAVINNFYFQIVNNYVCRCGYINYSFDKMLDLPLLIPGKDNNYLLNDLLKVHFGNTITTWLYKCEQCKVANLNRLKFIKFDSTSNFLLISIQRINRYLNIKHTAYIEFEETLNIKDFMDSNTDTDINYNLLGIVYHLGSINFGHYYCIIRILKEWYEFNDSNIKKVNNMKFKSNLVCALIYEKS